MCSVSFGNGLGNALISADQIQAREPVEDEEEADRDDHDRQDRSAFATGRITTRWINDAADERDREREDERRPVRQPWFSISVQAM